MYKVIEYYIIPPVIYLVAYREDIMVLHYSANFLENYDDELIKSDDIHAHLFIRCKEPIKMPTSSYYKPPKII